MDGRGEINVWFDEAGVWIGVGVDVSVDCCVGFTVGVGVVAWGDVLFVDCHAEHVECALGLACSLGYRGDIFIIFMNLRLPSILPRSILCFLYRLPPILLNNRWRWRRRYRTALLLIIVILAILAVVRVWLLHFSELLFLPFEGFSFFTELALLFLDIGFAEVEFFGWHLIGIV